MHVKKDKRKIIEPFLHYLDSVLGLPKDIIHLNHSLRAPKLNEFCCFQKFNHRLEIHLLIQQERCWQNNTILLLEGWHNVSALINLILQCKEKNIYPCKHTSKETKEFHVGLKIMKEWKGHVGEGDKLGVGWLWEVWLENSEEEPWSWGFASLMWSIIHYT